VVADSHRSLASCRNRFSQLLIAPGFNDISLTEIHTAVPLVREPSAFEFEMAIEKLK